MLEQEYRSLQRLMEIAELRQKGIQDAHLLDWNFRVAEDTPYVQMGKRYVNNWQQVKAENLGLLFWGDVGTGKSFLAACIANRLLDQGVSVMMTNFTRILNKLSDLQVKERCQYIASFGKVDLLIIDDLGVERNSEFALEQVYAVIDERYKANLPLIITTNLTPRQMRSVQDVAHARIYSRVAHYEKLFHQPEAFIRLGGHLMAIPIPDKEVRKAEKVRKQEAAKKDPNRDAR